MTKLIFFQMYPLIKDISKSFKNILTKKENFYKSDLPPAVICGFIDFIDLTKTFWN